MDKTSILTCVLQSPLELSIAISDRDLVAHDVDQIVVPIDETVRPNLTVGPQLYSGQCGRSTMTLSFRVTSNCPTDLYGPTCTTICSGQTGPGYCNYLGQCNGNFRTPNCTTCMQNYFPPNVCDTFCVPQDNDQGHFSCNRTTGQRSCLPGFTDVDTNCTAEIGESSVTNRSIKYLWLSTPVNHLSHN